MEFVILDLEWNPTYSKKLGGNLNEIIEFGAVKVSSSMELHESFSMLVRPQISKKISGKITTLTNITNDDVAKGCTYTHALSKFKRFLGDAVLMTWSITDIYVLMENTKYYLQDDRLPFIKQYVDIQDYCNAILVKKGLDGAVKAPGKQLGLMTAAELLNIEAEDIPHHRALGDSILSYECFKRLYSYPLLLPHIITVDNDFFRRLTFKNTILCDLNNPLIDKSEMYFVCSNCGHCAKRKKKWKFTSKSFVAPFRCKTCGNKFVGRIQFKLKYDGVHVIKKVVPPYNQRETTQLAVQVQDNLSE